MLIFGKYVKHQDKNLKQVIKYS